MFASFYWLWPPSLPDGPKSAVKQRFDRMYWGWKLGFGLTLAGAVVGYTAAIAAGDSILTMRSVRWLIAIGLLVAAIGVITYYYSRDTGLPGDLDETGTVTLLRRGTPALVRFAYVLAGRC